MLCTNGGYSPLFTAVDVYNLRDMTDLKDSDTDFIIKSASIQYTIKHHGNGFNMNNSPGIAFVTAYYYTHRKNQTTADVIAPGQAMYTVASAFKYGFVTQQSDSSNVQYQQHGVTPFMNKAFTDRYKIWKVKRCVLSVGQYKNFYIKKKNVNVKATILRDLTLSAIGGVTTGILFVIHGGLGRSAAGGVGNTAAAICIQSTERYKFMDLLSDLGRNEPFVQSQAPEGRGTTYLNNEYANNLLAVAA